MTIRTGTYTGNGGRQDISLGFRPELVFAIPTNGVEVGFKTDDLWCRRSNGFAAIDSFLNGAKLTSRGFVVGSSARFNTKDVVYHYIALARSSAFKLAFAGIQGNGQNGRAVKLDDPAVTPVAVLGKRDSTRDGVLKIGNSDPALMGGTAVTVAGAISSFVQGGFTVSNSVYVNEYDAASELGEGIDFAAFEAGENVAIANWAGTGALQTVPLPFQPKVAIVVKLSGATLSSRIKTDTMGASEAKSFGSTAIADHGMTFVPAGIQLSSGSTINANGVNYAVLAFKDHSETALAKPSIGRRGAQAILLPGRTSDAFINCGVDAGMEIDGAISLEWLGSIEPNGRATPVPLLWRGSATTVTANSCSFALFANGYIGAGKTWAGPSLAVACTDRIDLATASADIRYQWRTGLLLDFGKLTHLVATHDGLGGWSFYWNGKLVRQRRINLATEIGLPNINGDAGHRTMIGAMRNAGATVNARQRQTFVSARVSNVELTAAEVAARFARAALGSSETDVVRGLVEGWEASSAFGATLPALVNSANNGAMTNCELVAA